MLDMMLPASEVRLLTMEVILIPPSLDGDDEGGGVTVDETSPEVGLEVTLSEVGPELVLPDVGVPLYDDAPPELVDIAANDVDEEITVKVPITIVTGITTRH